MSEECVLVVDDSQQTRDLVVEYVLAPNGYRFETARDGAEGLRKALDTNPDLIIMDLEMPKMTGLEVLEALHEKRVNIPSIMMTFHGSERVAVQAFRLGVRDYVIKPFDVNEMVASVERALTEARLRRERDALTSKLILSNRQLEARVRDLNALHGIGRSVTALLDHDGLLTRVVEAALYVTTAEEGAIFLFDDAQSELREHVALRRNNRRVPHASGQVPLQFAKQAVRRLQPVYSWSVMAVPLVVGGKVLGALGVSNCASPRCFTDLDQQMLQALGDYAAIALHNARLFAEVRASKEREKQQLRNLFEHYVSPRVVERLIASPQSAVLGGVRQIVTVLFADVRGFSPFVEQTQPEVLMQVLNRYLAAAATAVLGADGTLDKFMGDAVMALFNAPLPQPDHALRAVKAAFEIQQSVDQVHRDLPPSLHLSFGIGICSGDAIVGNIGAAQLMNYTAMGDCVNVAKRLQETARGGQILLDAKSYGLVRGQVRVNPIGPVILKGRAAPEMAFELLGI